MKEFNKKLLVVLVILQLSASYMIPLNAQVDEKVTLVLKTGGGGVKPDYGTMIHGYLYKLNINVIVKVEEWTVFIGTILVTHDFDLVIIGLSGGGASPDMFDVYGENGSLNMFGINTEMPYGNVSEQMQIDGITIADLEERQQQYYDWQQLMMNYIVPLLPLFSPVSYVATWANTLGYDARWGIIDCLPYIEYTGLHEGQNSINEFRMADANWRDLNPLLYDDTSSSFISSLISEQIVGWSPDLAPLKTSLVTDWNQINENHYKFYMRDHVYFNPSYNITGRNSLSPALDPMSTPLLVGLKSGEVSYGNNQQVTAKDAVFTYLAHANPLVSEHTSYHDWISACYVDPVDPLAFHIEIDGNPETVEIEPYVDFWARLPWDILPEFFLNSSDSTVSYTSGEAQCTGLYTGINDTEAWKAYSVSAFSCGKYQLDYSIHNSVTVMTASPYWMNIGIKDGNPQDLDITTFEVHVILDISAELAEFQAGGLDWAGLTAFPTQRKAMQSDPNFKVSSFLTASFTFMAFNLRRNFIGGANNYIFLTEPGKEEYTVGCAIRKAICYAVDKIEMNELNHQGDYFVANSVIYPFTAYYYYNDIIKYDYDLELAKLWLSYAENTLNPTTNVTPLSFVSMLGTLTFLLIGYTKKRKRSNITYDKTTFESRS
ncbi:MAG: hypothetical protein KGD64_08485 [Candidatus Heimdallarchaeota archaeon]|nr:hypothetical protein [Candidatus Heimdallarchaeota archaeon]